MKIMTTVFANAFDEDICQPEFALLDLSKRETVDELRRWQHWAKAISAGESNETSANSCTFSCIVVEDAHNIAEFFNDSTRQVVGSYLTDPTEVFLGRPFLGTSDVYVVGDDVAPPDTADEDDPLVGGDGCVDSIYERELCVTPRGFYLRYELEDTSVVLLSQLVPWSVLEQHEEAQDAQVTA